MLGSRVFGKNTHRCLREGFCNDGFLILRKDNAQKGTDLSLEILSLFDELVPEDSQFSEGLDVFLGHLALYILSGPEELGDDKGVDIVGLGFFSQGLSELVGVIG